MPAHAIDRQSPQQWGATFSGAPTLSSNASALDGALLKRWTGTHRLMAQPPLDHHYLVLHLGGAKHVERRGDGPPVTEHVANGAITFVPAGFSFRWLTEGPIDFAHLYFTPHRLDRVIVEDFDREPKAVSLRNPVGQFDPLLFALYAAMIDEVANPFHSGALYLETLGRALLVRLLHLHSDLAGNQRRSAYALAPRRLRATLSFIDANLDRSIDLASIARAAGLSPYHFSRAFKREVGTPPCAFVLQRRIARAKQLLSETDRPVQEIARLCGFNSASQFSSCFKRRVGASPATYRGAR